MRRRWRREQQLRRTLGGRFEETAPRRRPRVTVAWLLVVAALLGCYELGRARLVATGETLSWRRRSCAYAAAGLFAIVGILHLASAKHGQVWGEALDFGLLAFWAPLLTVLAAPVPPLRALLGRPAARIPPRPVVGALPALVAYLAVTIGWRLPVAVDALATDRSFLALEAVTLLAGAFFLWVALVGSPPYLGLPARPRRIVLAAVSMWSVWVFAYAVGFSASAFYPAYGSANPPIDAQELSVGILWATSAVAFVPVVFRNLASWLGSEQALAELEMDAWRSRMRALGFVGHRTGRPGPTGGVGGAAGTGTGREPMGPSYEGALGATMHDRTDQR